jgi:hypothetical protein
VNEGSDLLGLVLSPELLAALDAHVRALVAEAVREELDRQPPRRWLSLADAAEARGTTQVALRARIRRGTVEARREGRRLYVRCDPDDENRAVP